MGIKKHIPNGITLLNLFCGSLAVIFAVDGLLELTAIFVMLGIFFDFFDGLAARMLNVQSELGLQLDSLADMVTSGVVPGIVMYQLLHNSGANNQWDDPKPEQLHLDSFSSESVSLDTAFVDFSNAIDPIALIGLLIVLASGYRLAKFNIDTRQTTSFIGVPTPAITLLVVCLPLIITTDSPVWAVSLLENVWFLIGLTLVSCYLLNAEIPLFALKFKTWGFGINKLRYVFLIITLLLLVFFKFLAVPCIIFLYVLLSILFPEPDIA